MWGRRFFGVREWKVSEQRLGLSLDTSDSTVRSSSISLATTNYTASPVEWVPAFAGMTVVGDDSGCGDVGILGCANGKFLSSG